MTDTINENPLRAEKRRKLHALREAGINPFPYSFERNGSTKEIWEKFDGIAAGEKKTESVFQLAGRFMAKRTMGKAVFFNIQDQAGNIQVYLKPKDLTEIEQKAFVRLFLPIYEYVPHEV